MMSQTKKLSIAFYWHMHQPVYQLTPDGDFIMPWVRLHAVKDYLDMMLWVEKFDNLKLNFNYVPVLLDSLIKYENGAHDIHSRISVAPVEKLSHEDKIFILNNFFDSNYQTMILPNDEYHRLYKIIQEKGSRFMYKGMCQEAFSPGRAVIPALRFMPAAHGQEVADFAVKQIFRRLLGKILRKNISDSIIERKQAFLAGESDCGGSKGFAEGIQWMQVILLIGQPGRFCTAFAMTKDHQPVKLQPGAVCGIQEGLDPIRRNMDRVR